MPFLFFFNLIRNCFGRGNQPARLMPTSMTRALPCLQASLVVSVLFLSGLAQAHIQFPNFNKHAENSGAVWKDLLTDLLEGPLEGPLLEGPLLEGLLESILFLFHPHALHHFSPLFND